MKIQEFFDQYGRSNADKPILLSFLPDSLTLLDNHLSGNASKKLVVQRETGCYLSVRSSKQPGIHFLNTDQHLNLEEANLDNSFREVIRKAQENYGKETGVELNYFSDTTPSLPDHEQWARLNERFLKGETITEQSVKQLLLVEGMQNKVIPLQGNTGFSLVYADLNCTIPDLDILLQNRNRELNEVLESINLFFELPSLGDLSGADQDWLDKLIEDPLLKSRLRHVVNLNNVHESTLLDFELNCEKAEKVVDEALNSETILGSSLLIHEQSFGSLHLIKTENIDTFIEWIRKAAEEPALTVSVLLD